MRDNTRQWFSETSTKTLRGQEEIAPVRDKADIEDCKTHNNDNATKLLHKQDWVAFMSQQYYVEAEIEVKIEVEVELKFS